MKWLALGVLVLACVAAAVELADDTTQGEIVTLPITLPIDTTYAKLDPNFNPNLNPNLNLNPNVNPNAIDDSNVLLVQGDYSGDEDDDEDEEAGTWSSEQQEEEGLLEDALSMSPARRRSAIAQIRALFANRAQEDLDKSESPADLDVKTSVNEVGDDSNAGKDDEREEAERSESRRIARSRRRYGNRIELVGVDEPCGGERVCRKGLRCRRGLHLKRTCARSHWWNIFSSRS